MKNFTTIITGILVTTAVLVTTLSGCDKQSDSGNSSTEQSTKSTVESTQSTESISEPVPDGEPTTLTCLDGRRIYTSEINENITDPEIIDRLTNYSYVDGLKPEAMIDTFMYFKPSTGISYNIYDNPELYGKNRNGYNEFIGAVPKNTNKWRRVYVGEKICGLTLKTAEMGLTRYGGQGEPLPTQRYYCEFEGAIELTGILYVSSPTELYNIPGGGLNLYFPNGELPIIPNSMVTSYSSGQQSFETSCIFNHGNFIGTSEIDKIGIGTVETTTADLSGLRFGDVVKVRATISGLKCSVFPNGVSYDAHLDAVEILSDVIEHDD